MPDSSNTYTQEITISPDTTNSRIALNWDKLGNIQEWKVLSFVRYKPYWIQPQIHQNISSHPHFASHLLLLKSPDWATTLVIYPVSTLNVNNVLLIENNQVKANVQRVVPTGQEEKVWVVCLEARSIVEERRSVRKVVEIARHLVVVKGNDKVEEDGREMPKQNDDLWDGLGICTWESFLQPDGTRARPTLALLLSLIPPEIPIKTYLIDDGWQDVHTDSRSLNSFQPYENLGDSMKNVVKAIKSRGVEKVGVWLTIQGYWEGIYPQSPLIEEYKCREYKKDEVRGGLENEFFERGDRESDGVAKTIWLPPPNETMRFWNDWFGLMRSWGIEFVKVDNQADSSMAIDPEGFHAQQSLWSSMLEAAQSHFGVNGVIMCMAHNERMLNGPGGLDSDRPRGNLVFRNSDDFALNYSNTHPDHIHYNLYNTILTSKLSLIPDFDMFASAPPSLLPKYHALLRSLGPGPILLSDTPNTTSNTDIIAKLMGETKDGKTKTLKSPEPAQVLSNRWFWDNLKEGSNGPALIAGSKYHENLGGILGVWNIHDYNSDAIARDKLTWRDIEDLMDLEEGNKEEYILSILLNLSEERQNSVYVVINSSNDCHLDVELKRGECEMICVTKLHRFGSLKLGIIGLKDKFACLAGITNIEIDEKEHSFKFSSTYSAESLQIIVIDNHENRHERPIKTFVDGTESVIGISNISVQDGDKTVQGRLLDVPFPNEGNTSYGSSRWKFEVFVQV